MKSSFLIGNDLNIFIDVKVDLKDISTKVSKELGTQILEGGHENRTGECQMRNFIGPQLRSYGCRHDRTWYRCGHSCTDVGREVLFVIGAEKHRTILTVSPCLSTPADLLT
jgi:hypothetical protein